MKPAPAFAASASWLTETERSPRAIGVNDTLAHAVDVFQRDPDLRLLPLLDPHQRPTGAIFEKDVRRLLLNPFGHALLRNPSLNSDLREFVRRCPTHEVTDDIGRLVDHYRRCDGREGMVLTRDGALFATLTNRRLLMLAAEHEHLQSLDRLAKAERVSKAGEQFECHVSSMTKQMVQLANAVQKLAEATVDRSTIAGTRAATVASAAIQTRNSMEVMAARGKSLATAFAGIERAVETSRRTASETANRVSEGNRQAQQLLSAAQSVDSVMALVNEIAGTVNLLSLNATIEAARAGEAGRGFAVVASEIRALSDQTQTATLQIAGQVNAMRDGAANVADDYAAMDAAIAQLSEQSASVDRAIGQEADTTRMIATSVSEASSASVEIEEAVSAIVHSVKSAGSSARELDGLANQLRQGATALDTAVNDFLIEIRA